MKTDNRGVRIDGDKQILTSNNNCGGIMLLKYLREQKWFMDYAFNNPISFVQMPQRLRFLKLKETLLSHISTNRIIKLEETLLSYISTDEIGSAQG